jgi:WG containing repeat
MIGGIVFWLAAATTGAQTIACRPFPPLHDDTIVACAAQRADGSFRVLPPALRALEFDQGELAVATIEGQLHYIHRSGRTAPVLRFDNGADYFVEGVARTLREGKVGFIDRRLVEVIPARWDFAFPFKHGLAVVCNGCKPTKDGEHGRVDGGAWGYIDHKGRAVVAIVHSRQELPTLEDALTRASGSR